MVSSHHGAKIKSHSEVHFTALTWKGQKLTYGYLRLVRLRFICFAMCRGSACRTYPSLEKDVFRLFTSVGQRKNSHEESNLRPSDFHAPMLYH